MPLWAWIGFVVLSVYFGFRIVRSARTGAERYGIFECPRGSDPVQFWFFVSIDLLGFVFLLGLLLLVVKAQVL